MKKYLAAIKIVSALVVVVIVAYGLYLITNLKGDLAQSESNNTQLTSLIGSQESLIRNLESDIVQIKESVDSVNQVSESQRKEIKKLSTKFTTKKNGKQRDFGKLVERNPHKLQKIINTATMNVNRCFEILTGAKIKKGETNDECQDIIDSIN
jgi:predicted PurR-regulated permease PerM